MTSLRGGFRSMAHGVTGSGRARPGAKKGGRLGTLVTLALLLAAVALLLHRFGIVRW